MDPRTQYQQYPGSQPPMQPPMQPPLVAAAPQQQRYKAITELKEAVNGSQEKLVDAKSTFPFVLFPDTICIDRTKATITHSTFFKTGEVMSIPIQDILNVTANVGPFFGSVQITTRFFDEKKPPYKIEYLKRSDALRIKRILQGYVIAIHQKIDCSALGTKELANMLDQLGKSAPGESL